MPNPSSSNGEGSSPAAVPRLPDAVRAIKETEGSIYALVEQVETIAARAMADPAYAAEQGIAPMTVAPLLTIDRLTNASTRAAWLRGAAVVFLQGRYRYEIAEAIDGRAFLVVLGPVDR